jgi:hypothetical protein
MKKIIVLIFISIQTFGQEAKQMRSSTEGFSFSVHGNYLGWASSFFSVLDQEEPNGRGFGLQAGFGINEHIELIGRYDRSNLAINFKDDWDYFKYNNTGLALRFNFGSTTRRFRPFLELGGSQSAFSVSPLLLNNQLVDYDLKGIGLSYSGGFNIFFTRNLSLELGALGVSGKFNKFLINGEEEDAAGVDASNFRIKAGIRFSFNNL